MDDNEININISVEGFANELEIVKRIKEERDYYRAVVEEYLPEFFINKN